MKEVENRNDDERGGKKVGRQERGKCPAFTFSPGTPRTPSSSCDSPGQISRQKGERGIPKSITAHMIKWRILKYEYCLWKHYF
jgi:hypothetical protein